MNDLLDAIFQTPKVSGLSALEDFTLPNVRKLFVPDPGYVIADSDLAQADAQVVAWEADDDILKEIFRDPNLDLHEENAKMIFGSCNPKKRKLAKRGVHATNYGSSARTLAISLGITVKEAEWFIKRWFEIHPGILEWHERIKESLTTKRMVENKWGYRRFYFDRIESCFTEAVAWIPQSSVAIYINKAWDKIVETVPEVEVLLQVHDSLVYQWPEALTSQVIPKVKAAFDSIAIPYDDPLVIPAGIAVSQTSWGDVEECLWEEVPSKIFL